MPDFLILIFLFMLGACVGSFLNVVVWRLPRGESLNYPGSHCPKCNNPLKWYDNIPILGWIKLYGHCRYCRRRISVRYPLVEALTALLFVFYYAAIYMMPLSYRLGPCVQTVSAFGAVHERFSHDLSFTWPIFLLYLWLICVLLAASLIDAELFVIPTSLIWGWQGGLIVVAILIHVFADRPTLPGRVMTDGIGGAIATGGGVGFLVSLLLLRLGKLPRSFADGGPLLEVEKQAMKSDRDLMVSLLVAPVETEMATANPASSSTTVEQTMAGIATPSDGSADQSTTATANDPLEALQAEYTPGRVRAEIRKEMLFLLPPLFAALVAVWLTWDGGPLHRQWAGLLQIRWISAFLGSLLGLLVGAFVVWLTRILGSLAFGREAMGMGDVDLMAGVGAALGAGPAVLAFFLAPFFGIAVAIYMLLTGSRRELPYGPYLSLATAFVMLWYAQVAGYLMPGFMGLVSLVHGAR